MKIGFVVNDVATEQHVYTTTRLAMAATNMGHEAWVMGIGDFAYEPDGSLSARCRNGSSKAYKSLEKYLADVQKGNGRQKRIDEFDVVMLRSDPADDAEGASWANNAGVAFGQLFASAGVLVVNDPNSLANALSKAYFQHFPEGRPPAHPHLARREDDQRLRRRPRREGGAQAAAGLRRQRCVPGQQLRIA